MQWLMISQSIHMDTESGWISQFTAMLQHTLDQRLGKRDAIRLFFDKSGMDTGRDSRREIEAAVSQSATMVVIYSAGYINSEWCLKELRQFDKAVGTELAESGRLFLVRLDNENPEDLATKANQDLGDTIGKYFNNLVGYRFYTHEPDFRHTSRMSVTDTEFLRSLTTLGVDLSSELQRLQREAEEVPIHVSASVAKSLSNDDRRLDKLFISYRREDNPYAAALIFGALKAKYGADKVVFDVDTIPIGVDFEEFLRTAVSQCRILLQLLVTTGWKYRIQTSLSVVSMTLRTGCVLK